MDYNKFVPFPLLTIRGNGPFNFDIFIQQKNQFVQISKAGMPLPSTDLEGLKREKVRFVYIKVEHQGPYNQYVARIMKQSVAKTSGDNNSDHDISKKMNNLLSELLDEASPKEKTPSENSKSNSDIPIALSEFYANFKRNPKYLKDHFGKGQGALPKVIKYCINVCLLVVDYHQYINSSELIKTESAVAALLHDIGLKTFSEPDSFLFVKDKKTMKNTEVQYYMTHAEQTIKALKNQKFMTSTVRDLILFHEENLLGTGPMKKKDLTTPQLILSMANQFDKYRILAGGPNEKKIFPKFKNDFHGAYPLALINSFGQFLLDKNIIELEPIDILKLKDVA